MKILVDTNLLTRSAQPGHPMHQEAVESLTLLNQHGEQLCIVPQNLYEFWVVATRALQFNGMEMTVAQAASEIIRLKTFFHFFHDTPAVCLEWERIVRDHVVTGRDAHDACLVAAMIVHGIPALLTFNEDDFKRLPGITILTPAGVVRPPQSPVSPSSVPPPLSPAPSSE